MSADNEIATLELNGAKGYKEYRVADNVSVSYNTLGLEIDLTDKEQVDMVYHIWKNAKEFYGRSDVREYVDKLGEENYYEYGNATFRINMDWADFILLAKSMGVC
jgi:hypothetical protein